MSNEFNNWNKPYKKPRMRVRPPPGLKGKEIGMFYRNLHKHRNKEEPKPKKEYSVTFTMPPTVTIAMKKNIQMLLKTGHMENIKIPNLKLTYVHSDVLPIKIELEECPNDNIKETFTEISQQYVDSVSNVTVVKSEPIDDDNMSLDCYKEDTETIARTNIQVKLEPNTELTHDKKVTVKVEPESNSPLKELDNPLSGTSTSADFKRPNVSECGTSERQQDLRPAAFKYGYEDIITGTFEEKLQECLANSVDITKTYPEKQDLNEAFYIEYQDMIKENQYIKMMEFRKTLPTYKMSHEILDAIYKNQVIVISGETGCGKSTQVPQIILDDAILNKRGATVKILVTQPRRIAASSLAMRVAKERAEHLGNSVGYAVRLERVNERSCGSIQYCTTGILLTDLETNQSLSDYSHIILDEVHERDTNIDIAMFMLKQVLKKRKDLKLILMSATIDSETLSEYFDNCLKMHIEGLAFPVKDVYLEEVLELTKFRLPNTDNQGHQNRRHQWQNKRKNIAKFNNREDQKLQDYLAEIGEWIDSKKNELDVNVIKTLKNPKIEELNYDLIVELIKYISVREPGAILVFVPGYADISKLLKLLHERYIREPTFEIHSLHSKLSSLEQNKIFQRPRNNVRKIIVATNIAETSITVDDIVYVIDCGHHKLTGLNIKENVETLDTQFISQANLRQRRGRAGRCQPGVCYHLLTSFRAERLEQRTRPELQRSSLLEAVLMVKRLRLGRADAALAQVPSPPAESTVQWAVNQLRRCGALDSDERLTPLGWHMARLPVHPAAGKMLLLGALFGCLDRAASIAAVWGFKDPFILVLGKEQEVEECKRNLTLGEPSDHVAISEAIINFERCPRRDRRDYCYANFLSYNTCELLSDMKKQLGGNLKAMGFLPTGDVKSAWENRNANNMSLFKAIVAAALYPNVATARWMGLNSRKRHPNIRIIVHTPEDGRVFIHPSSAMVAGGNTRFGSNGLNCTKPGANWLVYWMKRRSTDLFVFEVNLIYSLPLLFFGDFILTPNPETPDVCLLDVSSIKVRVTKETADLLHDLRTLLDQVLAAKVMSSGHQTTRMTKYEEQVLNTVIELITAEDEQAEYVGEDLTDSDFSETDTDGSYRPF